MPFETGLPFHQLWNNLSDEDGKDFFSLVSVEGTFFRVEKTSSLILVSLQPAMPCHATPGHATGWPYHRAMFHHVTPCHGISHLITSGHATGQPCHTAAIPDKPVLMCPVKLSIIGPGKYLDERLLGDCWCCWHGFKSRHFGLCWIRVPYCQKVSLLDQWESCYLQEMKRVLPFYT